MKNHKEICVFSIVDVYYVDEREVPIKKKFVVEPLAAVLMNFDSEGIKEYEETICALNGMGSYSYAPKKLDLDLKIFPTPPEDKFIFDDECLKAFEFLKGKLVDAFIIVALDWSKPFDIKCDVSRVALGAVLGQKRDELFHPIYYANKALNGS
ncbi:uncharacterized protein LOC124897990 [Capsicum annuum]|uniref:uncharacterized protein LOC124897990 n=1 Tax=Capsicum annuum TaxID=4072 RepID=UPI001FB09DDD|nr:uncharacterized protein LOC124897990 [Capsicum annuum]